MNLNPLSLITNLKKTDPYIEMIFMHGGCYAFHLFLKSIWPDAEPLITENKDHIATKIGGLVFDIRGICPPEEVFLAPSHEDLKMAAEWSFSKYKMLQISECPVCEEPIVA